MRQEACGAVREHVKEGMGMPVLRDTLKTVYVSSLNMFVLNDETCCRPKDCMW